MAEAEMDQQKQKLVPAQATQFPGSFASDLRNDHRKYVESRSWRAVLHSYFTDGWQDVGIYKSAVSIDRNVISCRFSHGSVRRVCWFDSNVLSLSNDTYNDRKF